MAESQALEDWIREEQAALWQDLDEAIRHAYNGRWSMQCSWLAQRIIHAARLVGATPIDELPWALHAGGVYEALLTVDGIEVPVTTDEQWAEFNALMAQHGGTRDELLLKYVGTRTDLTAAREAAFIRAAA